MMIMFIKATPESVGISSKQILKYLKMINFHELSSHSVLIARGDKIICEAYWKPFDKDTRHRMYSQTKSYVGLAVRLLAHDGKISLDDKIISYFPDKLPDEIHPYLAELSIRNMLMMRTCFDDYGVNWFTAKTDDRVKLYFSQKPSVYPGTQFDYDSFGSFVLGALVERLTGKTFLEYLNEKCLKEIGFSGTAYCLKCPGGYAWGDSALICTPRDMLLYGRFIGCRGKMNGKQIIPAEIIDEAFADETDNSSCGFRTFQSCGYASQFWRFYGNSVGFDGMHDQFTVYDPDTDITFTCTSGNYRSHDSGQLIMSYLFSEIIGTAGDALEENPNDYKELQNYIESLSLVSASGNKTSASESEIDGKTFIAEENKEGITRFSFNFSEKECKFNYHNEQGDKTLILGRCENIFQQFPQTGYSGEIGGTDCENHTYKCAGSFAWKTENQLYIKVQIIDEYIGNLYICFSFRDGKGRMKMVGDAENFLREYNGSINAEIE